MSAAPPDLSGCDREPIHVPGAIQPHGVLLVLAPDLTVRQAAGDVAVHLGAPDWIGRPVADLLGEDIAARLRELPGRAFLGRWRSSEGACYHVSAHTVGANLVVEVELGDGDRPGAGIELLADVEAAGAAFERCLTIGSLCHQAARAFRQLTGFDRVMIYRFLDDDAGVVVGEDRREDMPAFLNHHFPATDIPRQARALYLRNLVRVIPDVGYDPAPLQPAEDSGAALDMSDCALRSVSPVHLQYLSNMGVAASASVSIVTDGTLWGLVACHHSVPRLLPFDRRLAAQALAGSLARQLKARREAEAYSERLRLRGVEDDLVSALPLDEPLDGALARHLADATRMLGADGSALVRGGEVVADGVCPAPDQIRALAAWVAGQPAPEVVATDRLPEAWPAARDFAAQASGLVGFAIAPDEPFAMLWFRAEHVETIRWAGNPHSAVKTGPAGTLTPRASFEAWSETVRGRARPWSPAEIETALRFRQALFKVRAARQLRRLNQTLVETVADKDVLLKQQDFLLREVNHRVQNSLQLVSSFLSLQERELGEGGAASALGEARRRISAISLVHRRLYRADQLETVDLERYLRELTDEIGQSMGPDWLNQFTRRFAHVHVQPDRAVPIGLILTELVINAQKHAYRGAPGPLEMVLDGERGNLRLSVADRGTGAYQPSKGFGSRLIGTLVSQIGGTIDYEATGPGLRVTVTAPIAPASGRKPA